MLWLPPFRIEIGGLRCVGGFRDLHLLSLFGKSSSTELAQAPQVKFSWAVGPSFLFFCFFFFFFFFASLVML